MLSQGQGSEFLSPSAQLKGHLQGLIENETLTWLALGGNDIGDVGAASIATILNGDDGSIEICRNFCNQPAVSDSESCLTSLGLGGNGITGRGMQNICNALKNNSRLDSLGLAGNMIGSLRLSYSLHFRFGTIRLNSKSFARTVINRNR